MTKRSTTTSGGLSVTIPAAGHITIYDRSWYGRVLVERVEGYCTKTEWKRAYTEINEMEEEFRNSGGGLLKFWLEVSPEEQLKRFNAARDRYVKAVEDHRRGLAKPGEMGPLRGGHR